MSPLDVGLLVAIEEDGSIAAACRRLGIGRDRGMYRLLRLRQALGAPAVASARGGRRAGASRLTERGRRLLRSARPSSDLDPRAPTGPAPLEMGVFRGRARGGGRSPRIEIAGGPVLQVGFPAREGRWVTVGIDPEMVVVARRRFPSSARNALEGEVEEIRRIDPMRRLLVVRVGSARFLAGITPPSVRALRIRRGSHVVLYVKAVAIHPLGGALPP